MAQGYGKTQPHRSLAHSVAWAKNRRVAFLIRRRAEDPAPQPAVTGELAEIQHALAAHDLDTALARHAPGTRGEPGNVLALIGLGEAYEAATPTRPPRAPTARSSICSRAAPHAPVRRRTPRAARRGNDLAIDTLRRAVADRPDHLTGPSPARLHLVRAQARRGVRRDHRGLEQPYRPGS